eukprot:258061_1
MDILLQNEEEESVHNHHHEEKESFATLLKEIDTDMYTVAMGGVFVEIIVYSLTGMYLQLQGSADDYEEEYSTRAITIYIIISVAALWSVIIVIFVLFNALITFIQMKRDRALYKMCRRHQVRMEGHGLIWACIRCSYQWHKFSEHVITFIIGFLGWSYGWALASGVYWFETVEDRFKYSLCSTAGAIVLYYIRSKGLKRKYMKWKKSVQQTVPIDDGLQYDMFKMKARYH